MIWPNPRLKVHEKTACEGTNCCIHNPSDHLMKEWPLNIRLDRWDMLAERLCEHGIGHPDPDSVEYVKKKYAERRQPREASAVGVHGCDGCCRPASS